MDFLTSYGHNLPMKKIVLSNRIGNPDKDFVPLHMRVGHLPKKLHRFIRYDYENDKEGIPESLEAIAKNYNERHGTSITADMVILTAGARVAMTAAIAYISANVEISKPRALLIEPGYNLYRSQFKTLEVKPDIVNILGVTDDNERLLRIRNSVTSETLFLPVCNPNNPTGEIYSEKFLRGLLKLLDEFPHLHILNDSIYDNILRDASIKVPNIFVLATPEQRKRVYDIDGLSKEYAYPGIRSGWLIGDEDNIEKVQESKDPIVGSPSNIAQVMVMAALEYTPKLIPDYFEQVNNLYTSRMEIVHKKLSQIKGYKGKIPDGTIYYWANLSMLPDLAEKLAKRGIEVSKGENFGAPGYLRISCGAKARVLGELCDAIVQIARESGIKITKQKIKLPKDSDDIPAFTKVLKD